MIPKTLDGEILRRKLRKSYSDYCAYVNPGFYMSHFHKWLCDKVQQFIETPCSNGVMDILLLSVPPQSGKQEALTNTILTTKGWRAFGDVHTGDYVYAPDGRAVRVLAEIPQSEPSTLNVHLSNGDVIKVHPNHEWVVHDKNKHRYVTVETRYMLEQGVDNSDRVPVGKRGHRYRFHLPPVAPLDGPAVPLAVDPYVMGVWLGDGNTSKPEICAHPSDRTTLVECDKKYTVGSSWFHKTTGVEYHRYNKLRNDLRTYGLCYSDSKHNKYIPEAYLTASKQQRLELLAGLLDTDGTLYARTKRYSFSTTDEGLRDTFRSLIATFGWHCSMSASEPKLSSSGIHGRRVVYSFEFNPTEYIPCRIERKQLHTFAKQQREAVIAITPAEPEPGKCITVEGGVYLTGRMLTPTHNSCTVTETLPSWFLGNNPEDAVIIAGYEGTFAESFSRRNRDKFNQFAEDIFGVRPNPNVQGVALWETEKGGKCRAAGLKAGITGYPAELFIIDDPIKNREQAMSETLLAKIHDEMAPSVQTRIHPGGKLIVIQTRWVENDVIGWVQEHWAEYIWADINIPCECEDPVNDPLGRKLGESLIGEHMGDKNVPQKIRKDNTWLAGAKKLIIAADGEYTWNALYQGHPSAENGNLFDRAWWQYYDRDKLDLRQFDYVHMSVDATFKKTDTSDMVAILVSGIYKGEVYIWRIVNKRMGFVETKLKIKQILKELGSIDELVIEDKANGSAIIDSFRYDDDVPPIVAVNPMGGKFSRAQAVAPFVQACKVHLPLEQNWTPEERADCESGTREKLSPGEMFVQQHRSFPFAKHDDLVDANSQSLTRLIRLITGEEPTPARRVLRYVKWYPDMWEDFEHMTAAEQEKFIATYGAPLEWADELGGRY